MWFKNEARESKDKYDKFVEILDYWEHLHLPMALYCLNCPDASNDEAYAECLVDGGPSLAYRLKAACHIENNSRDKANTDHKLGDMSSSMDIDTTTAQRTLQTINAKMSTAVSIEKQPHVRIEFDDINDVPHVMTLLGMKGLVMNDEARQALAVIADQYLVIYSHLIDIGQSEPFAHQTATNIIQAQYAAYKD